MKTAETRVVFILLAALAFFSLAPVTALADSLLIAGNTPLDGITGYAFDRVNSRLYTSTDFGSVITGPGGPFFITTGSLLDLAFDGTYIWAGETSFAGNASVARIDPATGAVLNEYDLGLETYVATGPAAPPALTIPFMAMGVAWDGTGLWFSNNAFGSPEAIAAGVFGTSIQKYTWNPVLDTLSPVAGSSFTPWMDTWDFVPPLPDPTAVPAVTIPGRTPGGLAWEVSTGKLLIGTDLGQVYSYDTVAKTLGALRATDVNGGFVQGLETVPEPGTFLLVGLALLGLPFAYRRRS